MSEKCPNCGASAEVGARECGKCGLLFQKWRQRQEREKREAAAALAAAEEKLQPKKFNPWIGRVAAGVLVAVWSAVLAIYLMREMHRSVARQKAKEAVELRASAEAGKAPSPWAGKTGQPAQSAPPTENAPAQPAPPPGTAAPGRQNDGSPLPLPRGIQPPR